MPRVCRKAERFVGHRVRGDVERVLNTLVFKPPRKPMSYPEIARTFKNRLKTYQWALVALVEHKCQVTGPEGQIPEVLSRKF